MEAAGGGGGSEGMSHRNVAVIRTRGDVGRRTQRGRMNPPKAPPARFTPTPPRLGQQKQPKGSGFITKSTFDVAKQTTERMFENMLQMCTDLALNCREKAVYEKLGPAGFPD